MPVPTLPSVRWILEPIRHEAMESLKQRGLSGTVSQLLLTLLTQRGLLEPSHVQAFLHPKLADLSDPFLLPQMREAAERLLLAVDRGEKVVLYGDYDVDGVTSLTLLTLTLRAYGLNATPFLPLRMEEGYGLSLDGLARCFAEQGRPDLLVALDCGTVSVAEVAWLRSQDVDCVIVDHHDPAETLPSCTALVNPKLNGQFAYLCTVGLVFKLAHGMLKLRRAAGFDLREHLDLVAMGTVADLVPLKDENRSLVRKGLEKLATTKRKGICALKIIAGVDGLVQAHHIGYRLGPRLNAAGRLDTAQTALDLLLCEDVAEARECAELLDSHNRDRQEVEMVAQREALAMIESNPSLGETSCIVLGSRSWHQGVVGIVASRLMRDYHRPALMIAFDDDGMGKGSGRSVTGISMIAALDASRHLLVKGGGHPMAVGVSLREENLEEFRAAMSAAVEAQIVGDELSPRLHLAAEISLADLSASFLEAYTGLEPFGMGNPEPVFLCRNVEPLLPGQILKEKHWKVTLRQGRESRPAMWFNARIKDAPPAPWDVALKIQRQFWRGQESWQLMISDVRSSDPPI